MGISNKPIAVVLGDPPAAHPIHLYTSDSEGLGPCKPVLQSFNKVEPTIQTPTGATAPDVHQTNRKAAIPHPLRVSQEQRHRIVHRYNQLGHSIRKISREEKRARQTVTRIVRTAPETLAAERELENFQQEMKREFRGLAHKAFKSLERGLENGDWRLGFRVLEMMGIPEGKKRR